MNQSPCSSTAISRLSRRQFLQYSCIGISSSLLAACTNSNPASNTSSGLDKVTFGTNWLAQAEHGGFYQAIATGIYKNHGLDVTIKMGGPQVPSGTQLLMGGAVDFFMGYGIDAINAVAQGIPKITVAAIFQKDPQCIISHPNTAIKTLADLKGKPIYISAAANLNYWPFLKAKYGFTDAQKRPYNFNPAPFLADKTSAQQGYITSEPFAVEKQGGFKPLVFLLADYGYEPYATTIETKKELVAKNPDLVKRFVDASIKGWYSYLENPQPGNQLIKQENPEMTDEQIAYGIEKLKESGIILSGDAEKQGIGAMTQARWKSLFDSMVNTGLSQPNVNYQDAFTLQFVNQGQ
ncbi:MULTISPECIES: ABC transporter substrate-binding protein [Calothrix]|uniref:ABC transporter substrate-binding protein n=2 Tax=Calothrix TaxID=1186 RepID=A0ABR8AJ61_9CYAN|nr:MULTISPECIES: ABC transporter substrate-binding protein [Calothrix]MBD2200091.1 ABC transporter substrate-binding protein [Calothrix parietina FACHB-288]MBD2229064.1 ABC transporter substrate-binding protein [Calothrix anomala FACHB-343]